MSNIKHLRTFGALSLSLAVSASATGQDTIDPTPIMEGPIIEVEQPASLMDLAGGDVSAEDWVTDADGNGRVSYREFWMSELVRIGEMDLYGVSAQLPQGYLKVKMDYGWLTANSRYNGQGELGPVFQPIAFELNGEEQLNVSLDLGGSGGGFTFQASYGILDELDWYVELPYTAMNLSLSPVANAIDDEGNTIGTVAAGLLGVEDRMAYNASNFIYETFPQLGRPPVATSYDGKWLLGDINTGLSWNIFRNHRFSTAWTNRIFLPTGNVPNPESSITYATGPQPEIGIGGWGVSTTAGYDLRLYQHAPWLDIILSTDFGFGYFFKQNRDYPTNFTEPDPLAAQLDPRSFPDLSHLEGSFSYTPGFNLTWTTQLGINVAGVGLSAAYGWAYSQKPMLDADPAFVQMVDGLELLGQQSRSELALGASISLLPLYVPANIGISRRIFVDGRDTLVFSNFWQFTIETFAPLHMLWNRNRDRGN